MCDKVCKQLGASQEIVIEKESIMIELLPDASF